MFALDGIDWRSWTAADRVAVAYRLLKQTTKDPADRQALFELAGDRDALAVLARDNMGQTGAIEVTDIPVRGTP